MRFVLIIITITFSFQMLGQIPKSEQEALRSFYHATNGDNWFNHTNWNTNNPVDTWYGVSLIEVKGISHVSGINLFKNNLTGRIPKEIGQLTELTILNIPQNNITGNLPIEIKNCTKLSLINIEGNQITSLPKIDEPQEVSEKHPEKDINSFDQKQLNESNLNIAGSTQVALIKKINQISKKIQYSGKQTLLDATSKRLLDKIANLMLQNKDLSFVIEGHTDSNNTNEFNFEVGRERAKVVKDYLINRGVLPTKLFIESHGEGTPFAPDDTDKNKKMNRRVVFNLKDYNYTLSNEDWRGEEIQNRTENVTLTNEVKKEMDKVVKHDSTEERTDTDTYIPLSQVNRMPVFPGCEGTNSELKECFIENVEEHFENTFNEKLMQTLGLPKGKTRIYIKLLLDKTGKFIKPEVRAPHKAIKREIEMMVSLLPELEPGIHRGEFVNISYTFPYFFKVK